MKNIYIFLLLVPAILFSPSELSGVSTGSANITLRPSYAFIQSDTSQGAILVKLSGYSTNDVRYRLFNGSNQYACWSTEQLSYITSASYSSGPPAPGNPADSSMFWIIYQRGTNLSTSASYRDRIGPNYSINNNTIAFPPATAITDSFILSGNLLGSEVNTLDQKYVVLAWSGANLVNAGSSYLYSGNFSIYLPAGINVDKIEVRTLNNLTIAEVSGNWSGFINLPGIQLIDHPKQDSKLYDITMDGTGIAGFDPFIKSYSIALPGETTAIPLIEAVAIKPGASLIITPAVDLRGDEAARTTTIVVTAEDGSSTSIYKVIFTISLPGTDAFLLNLFVNGAAISGFNPITFTYSVNLPCGTSMVPTIRYTASDSNASITITNASNLNGNERERTTTIMVIAENGTTTVTYKVLFVIYVPGKNSSLIDFSINGIPVDNFDPGTFEYFVILPYGTTTVPTISYITADEKATAVISNAVDVNGTVEERTTVVMVTAEDGITVSGYKVLFSVYVRGNNASLADISLDGSTIDHFNSAVLVYNVLLPAGTTAFPVLSYSLDDNKASPVITYAVNLQGTEAERSTIIVVTAEDGVNILSYKVVFSVYIPGTDAFLLNLLVNDSTISGYAPGTYIYPVMLSFGSATVPIVTYLLSDPKASVSVTDAIRLDGPENERSTLLHVTAEDGITSHTYIIVFSVALPSANAFLSGIMVNDMAVAGFTLGKFEYTFILPANTITIPVVSCIKTDPKSIVTITNASDLNGTENERTSIVFVTAEDGINTSVYKIVFSVYVPGTDAFLSNLSVNSNMVVGFSPGKFNYLVLLDYGTTFVPVVSYVASDSISTVIAVDASNLNGTEEERTTKIMVTAEDGITSQTYVIVFSIALPGTDAYLSDLGVNGTRINGFTMGTFGYEVVLPYNTTTIPEIIYTKNDPKSVAIVINASNLNGTENERTTTVRVTAEDGITSSVYNIVFFLYVRGSDASLSSLLVNGISMDNFTPGTYSYTLVLPSGTTSIPVVTFTTSDPKAISLVTNTINLNGTEEERTTKIGVTSEDGSCYSDYKVVFSVLVPDSNALLLNLFVNNSGIAGFRPDSLVYTVTLPNGAITIPTVTFTTDNANATALVNNALNLWGTETERTTTILVTAEDGTTKLAYKVIFWIYVPGNNAFLSDLSINCTSLNGFARDTFNYIVLLPYGTTKVPVLTFSLSDARATADVTNTINLNGTEEERTTTILVTAENGITKLRYTIVFEVEDNSGISASPYSGISIFPVPALNQLTISGLTNVDRLDILDLHGTLIRKIEITADEMTLDISDLQNGLYFLRTESQTLKFVKE